MVCNTGATDDATLQHSPEAWTIARLMRSQGRIWDDIAKHTNIHVSNLRSRASREKWGGDVKAAQLQVATVVQHSVAVASQEVVSAVDKYKNKTLAILDKAVRHVDTLSDGALDLDELEKLARSWKLIDDVGRRTHGLDADGGRQMIGLRQTITIVQAPATPSPTPAIEV